MILDRDKALELLWLKEGYNVDGLVPVADLYIDNGRWTERHQLVVRDEAGKFWAAEYEQGLTEYQDTTPWEYSETVLFDEVEPKEVVTIHYFKVAAKV